MGGVDPGYHRSLSASAAACTCTRLAPCTAWSLSTAVQRAVYHWHSAGRITARELWRCMGSQQQAAIPHHSPQGGLGSYFLPRHQYRVYLALLVAANSGQLLGEQHLGRHPGSALWVTSDCNKRREKLLGHSRYGRSCFAQHSMSRLLCSPWLYELPAACPTHTEGPASSHVTQQRSS